ncbi:MAG TPA: hypothetical protein VN911_02745 [Candidatus Acidoferrum sp.]|nr:hypothetical protein [Candidatus Acidoferrum sp.]
MIDILQAREDRKPERCEDPLSNVNSGGVGCGVAVSETVVLQAEAFLEDIVNNVILALKNKGDTTLG